MPITAIEGVVENGKIRLREDVSLPERTRVYVIVAEWHGAPSSRIQSPRLAHAEQVRDFKKQVLEIPPDAKL